MSTPARTRSLPRLTVKKSMMPKGVEHTGADKVIAETDREEIYDAERR